MLNTTFFDSGIPTVPCCKPYEIPPWWLFHLSIQTFFCHFCFELWRDIAVQIISNKLTNIFSLCPPSSEAKRKEDQRFRNAKQKRQTTSFKCRRMTFGIMLIRPRTRQQSQSTKASIAATPPRRGARQTNEPQNNWPQPKQATNPDLFFFFLLFKLKVLQSIDLHRSNNSA